MTGVTQRPSPARAGIGPVGAQASAAPEHAHRGAERERGAEAAEHREQGHVANQERRDEGGGGDGRGAENDAEDKPLFEVQGDAREIGDPETGRGARGQKEDRSG